MGQLLSGGVFVYTALDSLIFAEQIFDDGFLAFGQLAFGQLA